MPRALGSARNGNVEFPVHFLKAKQGYTVRKKAEDKWTLYILISAGMKFRNKHKFRYGIPAHTGTYRLISGNGHKIT
jgi:hypothetical protein